jgi:outer membrane protein, heavy metal efflux system
MIVGISVNAQVIDSAVKPDTILSFQEANARMVKSNLSLLASYYDVNISQAKVIQAKAWNNPYFIINGDMYNAETNEYFHIRNQNLFQVEQTFSFAGKHTNNVKLARIGVEMAEKQLEDVLRSLHFELGNTYSTLAALQEKSLLYEQVIINYEKLMAATRKQVEVGSMSITEALRLESEFLVIRADALSNSNERAKTMSDMRILLRLPEDTTFYVEQRLPLIVEEFDPKALEEQAVTIRPDIQAAKINRKYQERNLKLQRSSGVPDIKIGYQPRDRGSNYLRPYQGFTTELTLPLFDRNQGRIKQAEHSIAQAELQFEEMDNRVRNEVAAAYSRFRNSNAGLVNYKDDFLEKLRDLNRANNENFQKRNIGLLQFIDQQRIFIQTNIQLIELKQQFLNNVNELNFSIGTNVIEY